MKTLTVSLRFAKRSSDVISDIRELDSVLEPTSSNEWLLQTEDEDEEEEIEDTIQLYLGMAGIPEDEYEIEEV